MSNKTVRLPPLAKGLSARLLVLTVFFVMLAEVLIYVPSIARYWVTYLDDRLASAHLAVLALGETPEQVLSEELEIELLNHVGAYSVALREPGTGQLIIRRAITGPVDATYDLRDRSPMGLIGAAFVTLASGGERVLRIIGTSPQDPDLALEIVVDEGPLYAEMLGFSERILALSLVISFFTAALVFLSLHLLLVRPMRKMTESMMRFREDPEDLSNQMRPSNRTDEIGVAEHELASMQEKLTAALHQKARLAALGIAVTKINHDLKNILSTARLVSDRLSESDDPDVRRVAPKLVKTIDRAVNLCVQTLNFTREGPPQLELGRVELHELMDEVGHTLSMAGTGECVWDNHTPKDLHVEADHDQLHRVFSNIGHNAVEAGARRVEVMAKQVEDRVQIWVSDDGPGLPPRAKENIFQPFAGTVKQGGSGLGLAIARDLVRAHGGDIYLECSTAAGTCFRIELPIGASDKRGEAGRRGAVVGRRSAAR